MTNDQISAVLRTLNLSQFAKKSHVSRRTLTRIASGDKPSTASKLLIEMALDYPQLKRTQRAKKGK